MPSIACRNQVPLRNTIHCTLGSSCQVSFQPLGCCVNITYAPDLLLLGLPLRVGTGDMLLGSKLVTGHFIFWHTPLVSVQLCQEKKAGFGDCSFETRALLSVG